jgi:hypothetical protein
MSGIFVRTLSKVLFPLVGAMIDFLKTGYSPCCACAILFVLVDYYLSFPWFPVRLRNIRAILYLLIQGVGILTLPQSLTLLLTQRTMGMPRGVLLGTVESCVEKLAE